MCIYKSDEHMRFWLACDMRYINLFWWIELNLDYTLAFYIIDTEQKSAYVSGVYLFLTLWGSKVPPFPSRHLSFPPIHLPSPPLLFLLPLEVAPLIQLEGLGSAVSSHSGVWGKAPAANDFGAFWGWRNAAGDIQDARFQTTETAFPYILWRNPKANYCFHSVVTLLWGSRHADPHGIDAYNVVCLSWKPYCAEHLSLSHSTHCLCFVQRFAHGARQANRSRSRWQTWVTQWKALYNDTAACSAVLFAV